VSAATCAAATALTGVTVSPASYTYTTGTGNDNGVHTFAFTVANAYRNVKVRVKDNNSAVGCSSDNFAIRPSAAFAITSTNANNNTTAGTTVVKTGASFNLNATLLAGYDGTPSIDTTLVTGTPTAGILAGSFGVAAIATGIATGSGFTYSEAGNLGFAANAVFDSVFTAVDQTNDCVMTAGLNFSNTIDANGKFGCNIGSVAITPTGTGGFGRFIPDHFETAINSVANVPMPCPTGVVCPVFYNGFVYSGQPFTVLVTAKNLGGATTVNYAGAYAHTVGYGAWDGIGSSTTNNPSAGTLGITTAGTFVAGVSTPVLNYAIAATAAPTNIYIRATETEVSSLRTTNPTTTSIEGGVTVASGRVKVPNAIGSELLTLPMVANVQFYNGSYWVTSTTDNVTSLTLPASYNVAYKGAVTGTTTPTPTGANAVTGGKLNIRLSKPTGGSGSATVTVAPPSYLPVAAGTGLATFGVYKGNNEFIYQRENY
jgi:MSHA biogenesis protein MshQ